MNKQTDRFIDNREHTGGCQRGRELGVVKKVKILGSTNW